YHQCGRIFRKEWACLAHQKVHKKFNKKKEFNEFGESQDIPTTGESPYPKKYSKKKTICEVCGKKYASQAALKYHQRVHTGERPYHCSLCPKTFTMPLFLQIHFRTHTGEKPYSCPLCPKAFSNKAALLRHDRVHTGIKPYECPKCGKAFTQSNSMKLHVKTVHLKMPAPYKSKTRKNKEAVRQAVINSMKIQCVTVDNDRYAEVKVEPEVQEYAIQYKEEYQEEAMYTANVKSEDVFVAPDIMYEEVYVAEE
ncbi:zinc finger protein 271-like, partial [Aricia agestis]|uniref:zinc finger protein 271-like n=1 Tax=Aricia agestis TaxID=91739 RepID=UPI001C201781